MVAQGICKGLRKPDEASREAETAASRSRMVPAPGLPCGTRVPVAPPAQWPGRDGACVHAFAQCSCLPGGRASARSAGVFLHLGGKVPDSLALLGFRERTWDVGVVRG